MKKSVSVLAVLALAVALATPAAAKVDFVKDIGPIFEKTCVECHGPEKQKGKLRLDTKAGFFEGPEADHIVIPGKAAESELYKLITLPQDHDDIMPQKGDPLSKAQTDLIRDWINEGAPWPDGFVVGAPVAAAVPAGASETAAELRAAASELRAAAARLEAAAASLEGTPLAAKPAAPKPTPEQLKAQQDAIAEIENKHGVALRPIAQKSEWHEANFRLQGTNITDEALTPLKNVFSLVELNLANTKVTDAGLANISGLTNLVKLHLENTGITDSALAHLKNLSNLEYLNLYGTSVSDSGLGSLKSLAKLKKLYLWQTKVTDAGAADLQKSLPALEISRGVDLVALQKQIEAEKKKAEEEAKKKAEEEAKKKAEEEAKKKAEEEAKKKAEEEAKKKAEEEAKQKAEEEAKQKAEEEAKQKAEEEAKKK